VTGMPDTIETYIKKIEKFLSEKNKPIELVHPSPFCIVKGKLHNRSIGNQ